MKVKEDVLTLELAVTLNRLKLKVDILKAGTKNFHPVHKRSCSTPLLPERSSNTSGRVGYNFRNQIGDNYNQIGGTCLSFNNHRL